ncbi:MAG: RdgB/HAM1 family non-canonical purine NTP pyrophosphatase [Halocynthiibacter sp.]
MMRKFNGDTLIIASHNQGKIREIGALLKPFGVTVKSAGDFDLEEPEETEDTFAGNARIKAHFAAKATGHPALSDDSGLMVDALDGAPGVYTADWAETPNGRDFPMAMEKVQKLLDDKAAAEPRNASFNCTLCIAWPDGHDEVFNGQTHGHLTWPMRGDHGFGFDPVFIPNGHSQTFGEMTPEEKQPLTHRAAAFKLLVEGCFA